MQTAQFSMSGHDFGGYLVGHGLGWPLYSDSIVGHSGAIVGYLANMTFETEGNGEIGIVFMLNRGASLVEDDYSVNTFFPTIIEVLFDEADRLAST